MKIQQKITMLIGSEELTQQLQTLLHVGFLFS